MSEELLTHLARSGSMDQSELSQKCSLLFLIKYYSSRFGDSIKPHCITMRSHSNEIGQKQRVGETRPIRS